MSRNVVLPANELQVLVDFGLAYVYTPKEHWLGDHHARSARFQMPVWQRLTLNPLRDELDFTGLP